LQARLPAPDPVLTAELRAAIDDFRSGPRIYVWLPSRGAKTNCHSEFVASMFLADRQMTAAQDCINRTLMRSV